MGASADVILDQIAKQNVGKPISDSISKARSMSVGSDVILNEIIKQNQQAPSDLSQKATEFGSGLAKSFVAAPSSFAKFGASIADAAASTDIGKKAQGVVRSTLGAFISPDIAQKLKTTQDVSMQDNRFTQANTPAESAGKLTGEIGQAFLPMGGAAKGAQLTSELARTLGVGEKLTQFAGSVGRTVGAAAETAGQVGGQSGSVEKAGEAGLGALILNPVVEKAFPALAKGLEKLNLRLTPVQKDQFRNKLDDVAQTVIDNNIVGSPTQRLNKVTKIYNDIEKTLQDFLTKKAKDVTVAKNDVILELEALKKNYVDDADLIPIEKQITQSINLLKSRWPEYIPLARLNTLKRSVMKNAFNEAGSKVRDDVEFAIGDVLYNNIKRASDGMTISGKTLEDFNKNYGLIITARKLMKKAEGRAQIGLVGKLAASAISSTVGNKFGGIAGAAGGVAAGGYLADLLFGTAARSILSQALERGSNIPVKALVTGGTNALSGALQLQQDQSQQ